MKDQSPKKPIDFSGLRPASSYLDDVRNLLHAMDQAQADTEAFLRKSQETLAAGVPNGQKQDLDQPSQKTATQPQAQQQTQPQEDLQTLLAQLDSLVGLERVKENVRSLINLVKVRKLREQNGLPTPCLLYTSPFTSCCKITFIVDLPFSVGAGISACAYGAAWTDA